MSNSSTGVVEGNQFDKYRSQNAIHRWLMERFLESVSALYDHAGPLSVLEVGCGPGDLALALSERVQLWCEYVGTDISETEVLKARRILPGGSFRQSCAERLPFADNQFDLVLACEVLEQLRQPSLAVEELARVSRRWILASVPWEPVWRTLNVIRGSYLRDWGNTPGHLQQFSRREFRSLFSNCGFVRAQRTPFPWTVVLVELL